MIDWLTPSSALVAETAGRGLAAIALAAAVLLIVLRPQTRLARYRRESLRAMEPQSSDDPHR